MHRRALSARRLYGLCLGRKLPLLTILIALFSLHFGAVQAEHWVHCDIQDHSYTGPGTRYFCRPVPDDFLDNARAKIRYIREVSRRKESERNGGPRFVLPDICDFGFSADFCGSGNVNSQGSGNDLSGSSSASGRRSGGAVSSMYVKRIGAEGIGLQWIIDVGFIAAYDIWGEGAPGEVCLDGLGSLLFIDTGRMPRAESWLDTSQRDGRTCARLDRPGMLVLMPAGARFRQCQFTTTGHLRVRTGPSLDDDIIGYVPRGTTLRVKAISGEWLNIEYEANSGWLGGAYVTMDCGESAPEPATVTEPTAQSQSCSVTSTGNLRILAGPSKEDDTIGFVRSGITLHPISRSGAWIEIAYQGKTGWIGAAYVKMVCGESAPEPASATEGAAQSQSCSVATTGHLRVRAGPSLDDDTIGFVRSGITLRPISRNGAWLEIAYQGVTGWIGAGYVSESADCG